MGCAASVLRGDAMAEYREMLGLEQDDASAAKAPKRKKSGTKPKPPAPADDLKRGHVMGKLGKRSACWGRLRALCAVWLTPRATDPLSRELHALQVRRASSAMGACFDERVVVQHSGCRGRRGGGARHAAGGLSEAVRECHACVGSAQCCPFCSAKLAKRKPAVRWEHTQYPVQLVVSVVAILA